MNKYICYDCKKTFPLLSTCGKFGNYSIDDKENKRCYDCTAQRELQHIKESNKVTLYYVENKNLVTNWTGKLSFKILGKRTSSHNWNLKRTDLWFKADGNIWHGVHIGHNTQLVHCKRTKQREY